MTYKQGVRLNKLTPKRYEKSCAPATGCKWTNKINKRVNNDGSYGNNFTCTTWKWVRRACKWLRFLITLVDATDAENVTLFVRWTFKTKSCGMFTYMMDHEKVYGAFEAGIMKVEACGIKASETVMNLKKVHVFACISSFVTFQTRKELSQIVRKFVAFASRSTPFWPNKNLFYYVTKARKEQKVIKTHEKSFWLLAFAQRSTWSQWTKSL